VVNVGFEFRDSVWCKAEYGPALAAERAANAVGVLVACTTISSVIPATLVHRPRFVLDEVARLAQYLSDGNKLPFPPEKVSSTAPITSRR
jgi:hypothetical protein